ncbi:phosphoribosylanthranilate isomerase [Rhodospirillum sp. A1_3_36]|uniref:phosphoribosylanthranilate isomerase n=1 Tax=Rhodospirillum sp. A1_3_36 TaxID=3391666 RepID=UPI0039A5FBAB
MRTRVKVCCIASQEEARLAIGLGADAVGLVGAMPSGPGVIDDATAGEIAAWVPPPVSAVLLTAETTAEGIAAHVNRVGALAVQIVTQIDPAESAELARLIPRIRRIQVIHVEGPACLSLIGPYTPHVHAFLLDSGRPSAEVQELGGTGRVHNWGISRTFVDRSSLPVFLAGGLTAENVGTAINRVRPYGLDLCSGVRTDGQLDAEKLARFMAVVGASERFFTPLPSRFEHLR